MHGLTNCKSIMSTFVTQLSLQVRKLVLEHLDAHQHYILGLQSATGLNIKEELVGLGFPIEVGFICKV